MKAALELRGLLEELERKGTSVIDLVRDDQLQEEKIVALDGHRAAHPGLDVFEDRSLEVLSRVEVDVRARSGDVVSTIPRFSRGEESA